MRGALIRSGNWGNTIIMTYSEFGLRSVKNDSGGTDHSTAAPHFLMSGAFKGGPWGAHPDLGDLNEGGVQFTTYFRIVYDRVLLD